jgi:hypothetical protein
MDKKLEIIVRVKDENGEILAESQRERGVPYIGEIERDGFRSAFQELEGAILEERKAAVDEMLSGYLEHMSKKKLEPREV